MVWISPCRVPPCLATSSSVALCSAARCPAYDTTSSRGGRHGLYLVAAPDQAVSPMLDPALRPQMSELTLELSYALQLLPGLTLQPGVQAPGRLPASGRTAGGRSD